MGKPTALTPDQTITIVESHKRGETVASIAKQHHCRAERVSTIIRDAGLQVSCGPPRRYTAEDFCPKSIHSALSDRGVRKTGQFYCVPCYTKYQLDWYYLNRRTPEARKKHSESTQRYQNAIDETTGIKQKAANHSHTPRRYLSYLLTHARGRAHECTLTLDELIGIYAVQHGICALSGVEMTHVLGTGRHRVDTNISIDRIDSARGYTVDNVQLVCAHVNIMKQTLSIAELVAWCEKIVQHGAAA